MCRIAAYVGVPRELSCLLYDPDHSLERQAYAPREQLSGTVNVDGTGVAWWPDHAPGPRRYATTLPSWSDENLRELAPLLRARSLVAAVRGATHGAPAGRAAVAPFVVDDLAIAHNGWIGGFRDGVAARLVAGLPAQRISEIDMLGDSLLLALSIAEQRARHDDLVTGVATALRGVAATVAAAGHTATLNVVVGDGRRIVGARASVAEPSNSLYVLDHGCSPWSDGAVLASEPLDDGPWKPVDEHHLVEVHPDGYDQIPLDLGVTS